MFHKNTRHFLFVACTLLINTYIIGADTSNPKNDAENFVIQTTELGGHHSCASAFYKIKSSNLNYIWTTSVVKTYFCSGIEYSGTITETFIPPHPLPKKTSLTPQSSGELFMAIETYHDAKGTSHRHQKINQSMEQEALKFKEAQKIIDLQLALIKTRP